MNHHLSFFIWLIGKFYWSCYETEENCRLLWEAFHIIIDVIDFLNNESL